MIKEDFIAMGPGGGGGGGGMLPVALHVMINFKELIQVSKKFIVIFVLISGF